MMNDENIYQSYVGETGQPTVKVSIDNVVLTSFSAGIGFTLGVAFTSFLLWFVVFLFFALARC